MKRTVLTCALFLAIGVSVMAGALHGPGTNTVPRLVAGIMDGRFTFEGPEAGPWTTVGDVTGTVRHLGLAKLSTTHTPNADGTLSDGSFTLVAANGDEVRGTYEGYGEFTPDGTAVQAHAVLVITGGTGRFANATGTIGASFLETFDDPTWASAGVSWALVGIINY